MRGRTGCRPCSAGYKWSWEELRGLLPGLAQEVLRDDPGDLIGPGLAFDETADLRKGKFTACVSPQHAGVTGKVENCVTWVFAALVTALGQAWADFDVYMPDCWATDPQRRKKAGIPEKLAFATKPELAIAQVKRLMAAGVRAMWAAADEVYGRCGEFRAALRALGLAYVVIIPCDYRVTLAKNTVIRADQAIARRRVRAAVLRERDERPPLRRLGAARHRGPAGVPADPPPGPAGEPVHVLPVLGAGRPAGDHDVFHHHRRPPLAGRSRPPLLPVKRDLSFTAALLVLLPAFGRFLPGVVPSGRGCSSRAGGPCARGARASAARRR